MKPLHLIRSPFYGSNPWEMDPPEGADEDWTPTEADEREAEAYGDYLCDLMMEGEI